MENQSWGVHDGRTVQFLLPRDVPETIFQTISALVTSTFRLSSAYHF